MLQRGTSKRGEKRKGSNYGMRKGQTLIGTYNNRSVVKRFQIHHCGRCFDVESPCVDAVCGQCKYDSKNDEHSCSVCKQNVTDYKLEENEKMMPRSHPEWQGVGPETCAICGIVM